ncbi:MAG: hypothetical protein PHS30_04185, partial [Bacteroidales bacterium]|nr:hypothetical protein [Bacteroidales bacterium]
MKDRLIVLFAACSIAIGSFAESQTKEPFKIFQFPANKIPCIDGNTADWDIVPDSFVIGSKLFRDYNGKYTDAPKPDNLDIQIKVGWVKGMNKLYFLYEGYDNYWDFSRLGRIADIFELMVDADLSGGPFVSALHPLKNVGGAETYYSFHGVHAQNYHIFTPPAPGKDWAILWGSQYFLKSLPYSNAAYSYRFMPGKSGKLILEFMITPFDYVGPEGPERAVESKLYTDKRIGLCWAVIDYDDVQSEKEDAFWSLSVQKNMYGDASSLNVFR